MFDPTNLDIMAAIRERLEGAVARRARNSRPFVTLTYAQSLDGSIAARSGRPLALSGPESQALTHALRAAHDAILVGIGTVLADNPRLTVRLAPGTNPQPVVLDSRLRCPLYVHLLRGEGPPPWIAAGLRAAPEREAELSQAGARVFRLPAGGQGFLDLSVLLDRLAEWGVGRLMVEGGAQIISSFLATRLVDQVVLTLAPVVVAGLRAVDGSGLFPSHASVRLSRLFYERLGEDLVVRGDPEWSPP